MRESLRFKGKITSATISRTADKWFVSITVELQERSKQAANESQVAVGVDLGVASFATLSNGEKLTGPKPHKLLINRIRRLSKSLSRKQKGSSNRDKAKLKLSRLHYRISNIRNDSIHQFTTRLTKEFTHIVIEDLNVKGMIENRRLSRAIADMGFYEFRRQLDYKTKTNDIKLIIANRWFASSKTCSNCHYKNNLLTLSDRKWSCASCNVEHDRDINAAKNLEKLAVSSTVSAFGASSSGAVGIPTASYGVMN